MIKVWGRCRTVSGITRAHRRRSRFAPKLNRAVDAMRDGGIRNARRTSGKGLRVDSFAEGVHVAPLRRRFGPPVDALV